MSRRATRAVLLAAALISPAISPTTLAEPPAGRPLASAQAAGAGERPASPRGLLSEDQLAPLAELAERLSLDLRWLTADVLEALERRGLSLEEIFEDAPRYVRVSGALHRIRLQKAGGLARASDVDLEPPAIVLPPEVYDGLGAGGSIAFRGGEQLVLFPADFGRVPALAVSLRGISAEESAAFDGLAVELGAASIPLGEARAELAFLPGCDELPEAGCPGSHPSTPSVVEAGSLAAKSSADSRMVTRIHKRNPTLFDNYSYFSGLDSSSRTVVEFKVSIASGSKQVRILLPSEVTGGASDRWGELHLNPNNEITYDTVGSHPDVEQFAAAQFELMEALEGCFWQGTTNDSDYSYHCQRLIDEVCRRNGDLGPGCTGGGGSPECPECLHHVSCSSSCRTSIEQTGNNIRSALNTEQWAVWTGASAGFTVLTQGWRRTVLPTLLVTKAVYHQVAHIYFQGKSWWNCGFQGDVTCSRWYAAGNGSWDAYFHHLSTSEPGLFNPYADLGIGSLSCEAGYTCPCPGGQWVDRLDCSSRCNGRWIHAGTADGDPDCVMGCSCNGGPGGELF